MINNFEYVDLPSLPKEIIDDIYNTINECRQKNILDGEKYPTWQSFRPSKKTRNYILNLINKEKEQVLEHDVHISYLNGNLPIHNDTCRDTAFNYVIESGGHTLTNFWTDDMKVMVESHHIEEHKWHRLNVKNQHSVDIEINPRIIITVGTPWKNRINTEMIIEDMIPNIPKDFISLYKKYCNYNKGTVFDFGSGDGSNLMEFSKEFPELSITGFEGSVSLSNIAIENVQGIKIENCRFTEIIDKSDCIISSYTLRHQHDANGNFWMPMKLIARRMGKPIHICVVDYERPNISHNDKIIMSAFTREEVLEQLTRIKVRGLQIDVETMSDGLNRLIIHGLLDEH